MDRASQAVFGILVREHEPGLLAFVRSCVADPAEADDVVQETFLAAWRQLGSYDEERPFAAWLRGIARNKILEHNRNRATARRHVVSVAAETIDEIAQEHERLTAVTADTFFDRLRPLRECIAQLPDADRDVLERHYSLSQTCRCIAGQLGVKLETVKKRLQRIRSALHDCILGKLTSEANRA
jgi:RNA polymerase sigma-70 factor (ECF subfamily)